MAEEDKKKIEMLETLGTVSFTAVNLVGLLKLMELERLCVKTEPSSESLTQLSTCCVKSVTVVGFVPTKFLFSEIYSWL